jgi:tetratricopeptide (TPR) repeat protein
MNIAILASVRHPILFLLSAMILTGPYAAESADLRGRIFLSTDQQGKSLEVVLKQRRRVVSRMIPDKGNNYEFRGLVNGRYELAIKVDKEEVRQQVNLCCGPNSVSVIDVNLDRDNPTIAVSFPIEPPDIVNIRELQRNYPPKILKEYEKARTDMRMGKFDRAADRLRQIVQAAPDFYSARARLGMAYQSMGCYPEAEREYVRARELNPKATQPMVNLGNFYLEASGVGLGDGRQYLKEAIAILQEVVLLQPASSLARCLLGTAYFRDESYEAAEENLRRVLGKEKRFEAAYLMLANVYMRQKRWQDAIEHIDIYLRENPFSPDRGKIRTVRKEIAGNL